jgi:hypothetical protein
MLRRAAGWALVAGATAAVAAWRRRSARRERVDLYFSDGSMIAFDDASEHASELLPLARDVVSAARG